MLENISRRTWDGNYEKKTESGDLLTLFLQTFSAPVEIIKAFEDVQQTFTEFILTFNPFSF